MTYNFFPYSKKMIRKGIIAKKGHISGNHRPLKALVPEEELH